MTEGVYVDLPRLVRLKYQGQGFSFLPRQPIHSLLAGQKASRIRGRGLNFEEIRRYLPGDDIRNIDWKATARTTETQTRVFTEERDRPCIVVVDQRLKMFFGSQVAFKSVVAAEIAALAAWRVTGVGDRIGAVVFNDTETVEIRPHRSQKTTLSILNAIVRQNRALEAEADAPSRPERLNEVLARACRLASHDYLVVLISDLDGADAETKRLMTRLAEHNDVLVAFVYDPLEADFPDLGKLVVSDGQMQLEVDSSNESLRQGFADTFNERVEEARRILLRREIPVLPIHTSQPVAEQIRRHLGYSPGSHRG